VRERPVFPKIFAACPECAWSSCGADEGEEMENTGLELVRLDALGVPKIRPWWEAIKSKKMEVRKVKFRTE